MRGRLLRAMAERLRRGDELLAEYVERIAERFPEARVLLVGSRARGDHLPYSDYDIVVVLPRVGDRIEAMVELRRLKPRGLSLDLIVLGEDELGDPLVAKMLENAVPLHEPRRGATGGRASPREASS